MYPRRQTRWNHDFLLAIGAGATVAGRWNSPVWDSPGLKTTEQRFGRLGTRKDAEISFQFQTLTYRNIEYPLTAESVVQPMTYFESMLQILWLCFTLLVQTEPLLFGLTLLAGVILAALCWWAATHYSRLFNLTFQITRLHQILCAGAAMLTLIFCLLFVSLKFTKQIAQQAIDSWNHEITTDTRWQYRVGVKIYYLIKATGAENFAKYPPPTDVGVRFPANKPSSRHIMASVPANEALHLFQISNPYLSHVLSLPARMPEGTIISDVNQFFAQFPNGIYYMSRAINLAAREIKSRLDPETPKAVTYARLILTACFFAAQSIPFVWIGIAAYRDLQVKV
jgi:hypothetical protein